MTAAGGMFTDKTSNFGPGLYDMYEDEELRKLEIRKEAGLEWAKIWREEYLSVDGWVDANTYVGTIPDELVAMTGEQEEDDHPLPFIGSIRKKPRPWTQPIETWEDVLDKAADDASLGTDGRKVQAWCDNVRGGYL